MSSPCCCFSGLGNAALLRGGEGASWGEWLARQKERVLKTIQPYGKVAYEKAKVILAWTKKKGAEAAKYTWKKTKQGGKWVKRKGSAGLSRAQKAAKRKACKMSNKACASEFIAVTNKELNKMMTELQEVQSERKIYKRMYGGQQQFFMLIFGGLF